MDTQTSLMVRNIIGALPLAVLSCTLSSCGGGPAAPGPVQTQPGPASLRVLADPVVDLTPGDIRALRIEERDASGQIVTQPSRAYTWSSSDSAIVSVAPDGILTARSLGGAAVSVRSRAGMGAAVHVWVQPPEHVDSTYRITLIFSEDIPGTWRETFQWAARQYEKVIRSALPAHELTGTVLPGCGDLPGEIPVPRFVGTETGTRIYVGRRGTPGPATGGVCMQRAWPRPTAVVGRITVGRDGNPDPVRIVTYLALHEMGHALGLVGLSTGIALPWIDRSTRRYSGAFALEGYRRQTGRIETSLPVEGAHWAFPADIMSAQMPALWISKASAGALMDTGYPAAWYGAH